MRYNMYSATAITGNAAPGVSSGQATAKMAEIADRQMPRETMAREWTELAYLQKDAGNLALFIFALAVSFVFLVLAAQYESWSLPLAVILVVPMCLLCSISGVTWAGGEVNIFTQIGFVVLVGLACKNAILIVEVAKVRQEEGVHRRRGGPGGVAAAFAADPDDLVRLHLRGAAADSRVPGPARRCARRSAWPCSAACSA